MSTGRCIYSSIERSGSPLRVITFPNGVSCSVAQLARHLGWPETTIRSRTERTDNPARLLGDKLPGRKIREREDWPAMLAGIEQAPMPREARWAGARLGWGYGAIDVESYLRRCAGASVTCLTTSVA